MVPRTRYEICSLPTTSYTGVQAPRPLDVHGSQRPTELARHLDLRSASVTVLLDRLEATGLIERMHNDQDAG